MKKIVLNTFRTHKVHYDFFSFFLKLFMSKITSLLIETDTNEIKKERSIIEKNARKKILVGLIYIQVTFNALLYSSTVRTTKSCVG